MSQYVTVEIEPCIAMRHRFQMIGSDKTPLKRSLICVTCTKKSEGKTVMVAHGVDTLSWGQWVERKETA